MGHDGLGSPMILAGVRVVDTLWVIEHFLVSKSDTASLLVYTSHEEKKEKRVGLSDQCSLVRSNISTV